MVFALNLECHHLLSLNNNDTYNNFDFNFIEFDASSLFHTEKESQLQICSDGGGGGGGGGGGDVRTENSRRQTISFILHLSHNFDPFLTYLSIHYLHRFLSNYPIINHQDRKPWMLRLLAVSCVSLALKMRKTDFSLNHIQEDGGFMFDKQTIRRMELLILGALKWRMHSITPFSFLYFFLSFFQVKEPAVMLALQARATQIIFNSQHDMKVLEFKPSIVAASALLSASRELFPLQFSTFSHSISTCSYVNKADLSRCNEIMEEMEKYESVLRVDSSSNTTMNVLDQQWYSSSDSEGGSEIDVESQESKRRKIISR